MLRRYTTAQAAEMLGLDISEIRFLLLHFKEFLSTRSAVESPSPLTDDDIRILQRVYDLVKNQGMDPSSVRVILRSEYSGSGASGDCQGGVLVFGGGRSGSGQSTVIWNLATTLSSKGYRATIFDGAGDNGGLGRLLTLSNRLAEDADEWHVRFHSGVHLVRGEKLTALLDSDDHEAVETELKEIGRVTDFLLVDTGEGRTDNALRFSRVASEMILVTTADVGANADCFAVIRTLKELDSGLRVSVLVNRVQGLGDAREAYARITGAARKLDLADIDSIGWISEDDAVRRFMTEGIPVVEALPTSPAARCFSRVADYLGNRLAPVEPRESHGLTGVVHTWKASRLREQKSLEV